MASLEDAFAAMDRVDSALVFGLRGGGGFAGFRRIGQAPGGRHIEDQGETYRRRRALAVAGFLPSLDVRPGAPGTELLDALEVSLPQLLESL